MHAVAVFDVDDERRALVANAVEACREPCQTHVEVANDTQKLAQLLSQCVPDVLFCDARTALQLALAANKLTDCPGDRPAPDGCSEQGASVPMSERMQPTASDPAPHPDPALGASADPALRLAQFPQATAMQTVLTGVSERTLVAAQTTDHAFLLPEHPTPAQVQLALRRAFDVRDHALERPFAVKSRKRIRVVQPSHVSYIESVLRKVQIHTNGDSVEAYGKLSDLVRVLPGRFVQCHKSFVVNMDYIGELTRDYVVLVTGECIPVSQKRSRGVRDTFARYARRTL